LKLRGETAGNVISRIAPLLGVEPRGWTNGLPGAAKRLDSAPAL
jgi:hypothetical protein